ncbi:hypothetical protein ACFWWT_41475 [Streptomyces sp. NPDC058676]|uniref:hypothetical protein n=1 Tax=unclassified Streptomyces TaxID=2593676 RepID=UPI0036566DE3
MHFTQLEAELVKGLAAHGWEDQRWTLERVKTVIGRRFQLTYTIHRRRPGPGPSAAAPQWYECEAVPADGYPSPR